MSIETFFTLRRAEPSFRDHESVVLLSATMSDDGVCLDAGAEGTVVFAASDDSALVVEFSEPETTIATLPPSAVIRAHRRVG